jgi:hypothetical protein
MNRLPQFQKRTQYFIRADDETFSAAMRVGNPDCSPVGSIAESQRQLHRALLRLSAMIYRHFISELRN